MIRIQRTETGAHLITISSIDTLPKEVYAMKKPIPIPIMVRHMTERFQVETLEGIMTGEPGDWLATGIKGEMYPIKADVFEDTYDIMPEAGD